MIKHIEVEFEDTNGIRIKSLWCHPNSRTRQGKMPSDPMEWFKQQLYKYGYYLDPPEGGSEMAQERIKIG